MVEWRCLGQGIPFSKNAEFLFWSLFFIFIADYTGVPLPRDLLRVCAVWHVGPNLTGVPIREEPGPQGDG